jgi:2,5-diketo-D-gluconate reductase A
MTTSAGPPTVVLRHGAVLPRLGLGTASLDEAATERAVATAIALGYRLIDTAENYRNEVGVGRGLKASGIARSDVFVTTRSNKALAWGWAGAAGVRRVAETPASVRTGWGACDGHLEFRISRA